MREQVLRAIADTFESIQKERIRANNKLQAIFRGVDEKDPLREKVYSQIARLEDLGKDLEKLMVEELKNIPVWQEFLMHVKGIGPRLAVRLLALPLEPAKHLSSWYAYFGLTPIYWLAECEEGLPVLERCGSDREGTQEWR